MKWIPSQEAQPSDCNERRKSSHNRQSNGAQQWMLCFMDYTVALFYYYIFEARSLLPLISLT